MSFIALWSVLGPWFISFYTLIYLVFGSFNNIIFRIFTFFLFTCIGNKWNRASTLKKDQRRIKIWKQVNRCQALVDWATTVEDLQATQPTTVVTHLPASCVSRPNLFSFKCFSLGFFWGWLLGYCRRLLSLGYLPKPHQGEIK